MNFLLALPLLLAQPAAAQPSSRPSEAELRASVQRLVGFGTRHTLSSATHPTRGIGAARRWAKSRFEAYGRACGGCLAVETDARRFEGPRAPNGVMVENVFAVQRGTGDPNRVVIVQAHIDSRVTDVMDFTSDAPGANDDGSGSALVLEAARLLSREKHAGTIVYALLSGEEQGLWGGRLLADLAKVRGWKVAAVLNNDIVGNTRGQGGDVASGTVRVFSEGIRLAELPDDPAERARRGSGGEDDGPSRALAKYVDRLARGIPGALEVLAIRRPDRFGRGGDQTPFLEDGHPAVRFSETAENYDRQHQNVRTEDGRRFGDTLDGIDFPYLARVTALNMATARALADAPGAPERAEISGAVSADTTLTWAAVPGAAGYRVRWRRADAADWSEQRDVGVGATSVTLPNVNIDNNLFGVAALGTRGEESLVTFAGGPVRR